MMSRHGGNPIFFNEKIKIGRPEHSLTPHPPTSDNGDLQNGVRKFFKNKWVARCLTFSDFTAPKNCSSP